MNNFAPTGNSMAVAAVGMCSCDGLTAMSAAAAMRAHVSRFEKTSFFDARGQAIVAAPAVEAVAGRHGCDRLRPLLFGALADCIGFDRSDPADVLRETPCLIMIGDAGRPDYPPNLAELLLSGISADFGTQLHLETRVIPIGTTGFFQAIAHARTVLQRVPGCLVVAVDSLINRKMLAWLDAKRRLKTEELSDGVIPGEAARGLVAGRIEQPRVPGIGPCARRRLFEGTIGSDRRTE